MSTDPGPPGPGSVGSGGAGTTDPPSRPGPGHRPAGEVLPPGLWRRLGLDPQVSLDELVRDAETYVPRWLRPGDVGESRWPAAAATTLAIVAQVALPRSLLPAGRVAILVPEILLAVLLLAANPARMERAHPVVRVAEIVMVGIITTGTMSSTALLCRDVVTGRIHDPEVLLGSGAAIYAVNVLAFGLWYWQLDGGGPVGRLRNWTVHPAFLFAQMGTPEYSHRDWRPIFGDYLYLSLTNVTAFSPTDTLPLARWAKALMAAQSLTALVLVALVLARAVNILTG